LVKTVAGTAETVNGAAGGGCVGLVVELTSGDVIGLFAQLGVLGGVDGKTEGFTRKAPLAVGAWGAVIFWSRKIVYCFEAKGFTLPSERAVMPDNWLDGTVCLNPPNLFTTRADTRFACCWVAPAFLMLFTNLFLSKG